MHSRLILKKLILTGNGKQDAVINFHEGLNVIAGASDTGKSFAFECINFILGSSEVPSCPPEAKGYQTVYIKRIQHFAAYRKHTSVTKTDTTSE